MLSKCAICQRTQLEESEYCKYHERAYENLLAGYRKWKRAEGITWSDYLKKLIELKETGEWVKDVATHQKK